MCEEKPDVFVKTREGTVVLKELIEVLSKLKPCPAFQRCPMLTLAAVGHATDLGATTTVGHVGSDGSSI